jgi:thiol-disulfide isomerase/thioredoxin
MVPYLVAGLAVVGVLSLFNLLLGLALAARLREHASALRQLSGVQTAATVPVGGTVGAFSAVTTAGREITRESLTATTVVAFFTTDCGTCMASLPEWIDYAKAYDGPVLAVVSAEATEAAPLHDQLAPVAEVIVEPGVGPTVLAFGVGGFPAFCAVAGDGRVVASGTTVSALRRTLITRA